MINLKPRFIFLILCVLVCLGSIVLVMVKGNPENRVSLDSVSEIAEGFLSSVNKAGNIFVSIDDEEEMEIGDEVNKKILKFQPTKQISPVLEKYVNDVGNKVAENVKRSGIKYKFHVVEGFFPAARSAAGGHVYVTTGLLETLKSEAELAGVLAHEITHVDAKHCINSIQLKLQNGKIEESGYNDLVDIGYNIFLRPGFSEAQEIEADTGGVYLAYRAGYHPLAIIYAFERVDRKELRSNQNSSATPVGDTVNAVGGLIVRYFSSHPPTEDRINKIKKYIADNKLMNSNRRFYVGQKNFEEKNAFKIKPYREEFKKDYIITEKKSAEKT